MKTYSNPSWWTKEYDSAWERAGAALRRDWEQTKHDFGGDAPDIEQDVDNTVKQAVGKEAIPPAGVSNFDDAEPAVRFGYGARRRYGKDYPEWDDDLEARLQDDWEEANPDEDASWDNFRPVIRRGWDYEDAPPTASTKKR